MSEDFRRWELELIERHLTRKLRLMQVVAAGLAALLVAGRFF